MKELWIPGPTYKWTCPECKTHDLVERDSLGLVPVCEKCGREMTLRQVEGKGTPCPHCNGSGVESDEEPEKSVQ